MSHWTEVYNDKPDTFPEAGQSVAVKTVVREGQEGLLRLVEKVTVATFTNLPSFPCCFDFGAGLLYAGKSDNKALGHLEWTPCEPEDFWELAKSHAQELCE